MALTNFRIEPKRETIESAVGTVVAILAVVLWWKGLHFIHDSIESKGNVVDHAGVWLASFLICTIGIPAAPFVGYFLFAFLPHAIGEGVLGVLKNVFGYDPRPGTRFRSMKQEYIDPKDKYSRVKDVFVWR